MIEISIVSGKGGVGKTIISSSISYLLNKWNIKLVVADADVDTPSLHLILQTLKITNSSNIYLSRKAFIDTGKCIKCYQCINICPYGAIELDPHGYPRILLYMCEGCGACRIVCQVDAVLLSSYKTGVLTEGYTRYGYPIVTAQLEVGEHNSGLLVGMVRRKAREIAESINASLILIDGAPGIGCPVIASITGTSYVIVVTEPTPEALKGALRAIKVARHFQVPVVAIINKYDISSYNVEGELEANNVGIIGKIPFDPMVFKTAVNGIPIVEMNPSLEVSRAIRNVAETIFNTILKV